MKNLLKTIDINKAGQIVITSLISLTISLFIRQACINFTLNNVGIYVFSICSFLLSLTILSVWDIIPIKIFKIIDKNKIPTLSMLLSGFIILLLYIVYGVEPFGDSTVIKIDMFSQYAPLHMQLYERITNFDFSFYNWNTGGGVPFFGDFFNYLSSPFTALIFLFPKEKISLALSLIVFVKISLSSFTFTYYLKRSYGFNSTVYAVFGTIYACSGYVGAYYWNIMWLDALIVLPLMILGIERIFKNQSGRLYFLSLVYAIYTNYYMGFILCITSVLYFVFYTLKEKQINLLLQKNNEKNFFKSFKVYIFYSLMSGIVLGAILIPLFFLLQNSDATSGGTVNFTEFNFNPLQFIVAHFSLVKPTILLTYAGDSPLPNIYMTIPVLLLVILYFFNRNINKKNKILYFALFIFFFFSFSYEPMNYIWHGFHFTNDMPYRNAFIYIFFVLIVSAVSFSHINAKINKKTIICICLFFSIIVVLGYTSEEKFKLYGLIVTFIVAIISAIIYFLYQNKKHRHLAKCFFVILIICDLLINGVINFNFALKTSDFIGEYKCISEAVKYIEDNDKSDYHIELSDSLYGTEGNKYGFNSISGFSSMANVEYSQAFYNLGMNGNSINQQTYSMSNPMLDLLLSTKYIVQPVLDNNNEISEYLYEKYYENDGVIVWKNKFYVSSAFLSSNNQNIAFSNNKNPFQSSNIVFDKYCGIKSVFTDASVISVHTENVNMKKEEFTYKVNNNTTDGNDKYVEFIIKTNQDGSLYINMGCIAGKDNDTWEDFETPVKIYNNGKEVFSDNILLTKMYYVGDFKKGETLELKFDFSECQDFSSGTITLRGISSLNLQKFNDCYQYIVNNGVSINRTKDNLILKVNNAKTNSIIHTNIPYSEGWSVKNTPDRVSVINDNGFLSLKINKAVNNIELTYSPKGLWTGINTSVAGILFIVFLCIKKLIITNSDLV